jgi:class 3 adenylate cyclase
MACRSCGFENPDGFQFCGSCGAPLEAALAPLEEERKVVTVLFTDLVGFTSRSERLDPEDVRAHLSPYYALLRGELERFGGTVEKFIGDAVMALFGAPIAHEDDAERAVRAALAIRDAVGDLAAREQPGLEVRIGVNTGEALVAVDASASEGEGMAAGDVINTAFRLQEAAPAGGILVAESTYWATEHAIRYRDTGAVRAKGKSEPLRVWEALEPRSHVGAEPLRQGTARLVGRTAELDALHTALTAVRTERTPRSVTLVGVPGIGKSRLVSELYRAVRADPDPIRWRRGRSLPYGEGVTFWAIGEITKTQAGILESDPADTAREKLHRAVREAVSDEAEARWIESRLRPLVGLAPEADAGGDNRAESFAAWRRFFEALAEQRPLVLVFEDLHWADEGLLDFVEELLDWVAGVPLLVVATSRPELLERRPGWGGARPNAETIPLAPLSGREMAQLLGELLPDDSARDAALAERAGGNPLYAEEYVRMLRERGARGEDVAAPASIHGIIAARIDGLPRAEKAILRDAAVLGQRSWVGALAHVTGLPRWSVEEHIHRLERKEFVVRERRSAVAGESAYAFSHALVRDVAYGQLPRARRAEKHRLAAEWIESLTRDRADDHADLLAHHYVAALELASSAGAPDDELASRARTSLRAAGVRALTLNAFASAARHFAGAVDLSGPDDADRAELLLQLGKARFLAEETGADVLEEAHAALLAHGKRAKAAEAEALLVWFDWRSGRRAEAYARIEDARRLIADAAPSATKAAVLSELARYFMVGDENEAAIELASEALAIAEGLRLDEIQAQALTTIAVARVAAGDLGGLDDAERALEIAEASGSPATVRAHLNFGSTLANLGDMRRAAEVQRIGSAAAERFGLEALLRWSALVGSFTHYCRGDWDEAVRLADSVIEVDRGAAVYWESAARSTRGEIRLARGDTAGALDDANVSVELARGVGDPQMVYPALAFAAYAHLVAGERGAGEELAEELLADWRASHSVVWLPDLARTARLLGRQDAVLESAAHVTLPSRWLDAAKAYATRDFLGAAERYSEIGSRPDEAEARLRAAETLHARGRTDEARPQLDAALAFWREVDARGYVETAESLFAARRR